MVSQSNKKTAPTAPIRAFVPPAEKLQWSVAEFCVLHHLSISNYYELRKSGLTPRELRLGSRTWITAEAAAQWRAERTAATTQHAPLSKPEAIGRLG
jgi:hypothetical protein